MRFSSGQRKIEKSYNMGLRNGLNIVLFLIIGPNNDEIFKNSMNIHDWEIYNQKYSNV